MSTMPPYDASLVFTNQNSLYANHYKFVIERLPDLTFFIQSVDLPSVGSVPPRQANPFTSIPHVADQLAFSDFRVGFLVDAQFKNYFSLYYWLKGYGFPHSFEEVQQFRDHQRDVIGSHRPTVRDLEKTNAVLSVLTPDTSNIVAEISMRDVFPVELGPLSFMTTQGDAPVLVGTCSFVCSTFDIKLTV